MRRRRTGGGGISCWRLSVIVVAFFALVIIAPALLAKTGVVKTTTGQTYIGDVDDSKPEYVTINRKGIPTRVQRAEVASIQLADDFPSFYRQRMAQLGPQDVQGRLQLARAAFEFHEYNLARDAADSALQIDPNNGDAVAMLETIRVQQRLEKNNPPPAHDATGTAPVSRPAATEGAGGAAQLAENAKLLKPAEINAIRQAEMRPEDVGVRIRFDRNVLKRYVEFSNRVPADFYALNAMQQAQAIMHDGPAEMRKDIQILNDPPAILQYRRMVQPFLVQNCATTGCHNGSNPKYNVILPAESDAATYTNFYILDKYTKKMPQSADAVFGRGDAKILDRQRPAQSLLLQYAMPGSIAEIDHPDVQNYRPPLRGVTDPRYRQMLDWVGSALQPVDPDYGFDYPIPGATQPTTNPAATQQATTTTKPATRPHTVSPPQARSAAPAPPRPAVPR
jgi:hypothetical protein